MANVTVSRQTDTSRDHSLGLKIPAQGFDPTLLQYNLDSNFLFEFIAPENSAQIFV